MKLSSKKIVEATERYYRERDRYEKLTRYIEEKCIYELIDRLGLQVNITARTKRVNSFEGKLRRFKEWNKKPEWTTIDHVFGGLSDFSGIRVIYYSPTDKEVILKTLQSIFKCIESDNKDRFAEGGGFYQAVHLQVELPIDDRTIETENLSGLGAEIQVCSVMSHVWNEIEHDIGYKPSGEISTREQELLDELGQLKLKGDEIIDELMSTHHRKVVEQDRLEDAASVEDYLKDHFRIRRVTFSGSELLGVLKQLEITTGKRFASFMGTDTPGVSRNALNQQWEEAKRKIAKFNTHLHKVGRQDLALNPRNSPDPAIFLILENSHEYILQKFPAGRGRGRPVKIRSLATQYVNFLSTSKQ